METAFILISWLLFASISLFKGRVDGYIWYYWLKYWLTQVLKDDKALIKMKEEGKLIHKITVLPLLFTFIFIILTALSNMPWAAVLFLGISLSTINPIFHLGAYFTTRNKLDKNVYKNTYKETDVASDGNTDKNKKLTNKLFNTYKKRVIFAIISILTLILTIVTK